MGKANDVQRLSPCSHCAPPPSLLLLQDRPSQQRHRQPPRCRSHKYRQHTGTCPLIRPNCHQSLLNIAQICPRPRLLFAAATLLPAPTISSWTVSQPPDSSAAPTRLLCHPPACLSQPPAEPSFLHVGLPAYNHCPGLGSVCPDKDCHPQTSQVPALRFATRCAFIPNTQQCLHLHVYVCDYLV